MALPVSAPEPVAERAGSPQPGSAARAIEVVLTQFRCYRHARLATDGGPVVLYGANGAGKTNLLEALSCLAPGRGLRRARIEDMQRRGSDGATEPWAVSVALDLPGGALRIGTGRDPQRAVAGAPPATPGDDEDDDEAAAGAPTARERRLLRVDGVAQRGLGGLTERLSVLWLTPQMDGLFRDGPSARRRFLDRLVWGVDPAHAGRVAAYEHAMRERLRLLADGRGDDRWLRAVEDTMAAKGVAVAAARRALVAHLSAAAATDAGPFPQPVMTLTGAIDAWLDAGPALDAEDRMRATLAAARKSDAAAGSTAEGPHRSDLAVTHRGRDMPAALCSTGEQKALLVSIVLANARLQAARRGQAPILLLDEVVAHLDTDRRTALAAVVLGLGAQAWMTGTDPEAFAMLRGRALFVAVRDAAWQPEG